MARATKTVSALKNLGYPDKACLKQCSCEELPCQVLTWLVSEIRSTCPEVQGGDEQGCSTSAVLVGELRMLLRDLHCPYSSLATEMLSPTLLNTATEFLVTELQAVRILRHREVREEEEACDDGAPKEQREGEDEVLEPEKEEEGGGRGVEDGGAWDAEREREVREESDRLFQSLGLEPSPRLSDAYAEVESRISALPGGTVPEPLLKTSLNSAQWQRLLQIDLALSQDYECRRSMMTKRFQVTLQSFTWGEKGPQRRAVLASVPLLCPEALSSHVSLPLLLAAREDQSHVLPLRAGPSTAVHKVLMGNVPDRGGRPGEIEPPMPSWERRREGGGRGGGAGHQRWGNKRKKSKKKE